MYKNCDRNRNMQLLIIKIPPYNEKTWRNSALRSKVISTVLSRSTICDKDVNCKQGCEKEHHLRKLAPEVQQATSKMMPVFAQYIIRRKEKIWKSEKNYEKIQRAENNRRKVQRQGRRPEKRPLFHSEISELNEIWLTCQPPHWYRVNHPSSYSIDNEVELFSSCNGLNIELYSMCH